MSNQITLEQLKTYEGRALSPSAWIEINQDRIDQFADCTDDHQFIHVDPEAARKTALGTTIAHGFLSLSLLAGHRSADMPVLENTVMTLNYGLDRVRFISPVTVNSSVRIHTKILSVTEKEPGKILVKVEKTMEIEGQEKPAFVAQTLAMLMIDNA